MAGKYEVLPQDTDWRQHFRVGDVRRSPIDSRDFPALAKNEPPVTLPASFRLEHRAIRNQGGKGACVAFTFARIFERALAVAGRHSNFDASEEEMYARLRQLYNWLCQDTGAYPRDAADQSVKNGWLTEVQRPYNDRDLCTPPASELAQARADEFRACRTWEDAKQVIYQHRVGVSICFTLANNFYDIRSDGIMPWPEGGWVGGHCMTLEGWDEQYAWVANSWSEGFGQGGYIRVPLRLVEGTVTERDGGAWLTDQFTVLATPVTPEPDPTVRTYEQGYADAHGQRLSLTQESVDWYRGRSGSKNQFAADVCQWHVDRFNEMTPPAPQGVSGDNLRPRAEDYPDV